MKNIKLGKRGELEGDSLEQTGKIPSYILALIALILFFFVIYMLSQKQLIP